MRKRPQVRLTITALVAFVAVARAQIVAETIGYTSRDRQMYGPAIRYLVFDSLSGTHAVWKDGYGSIRYNFRPRGEAWRWPGGMVVNAYPRSLGSLDINPASHSAIICADHLFRDTHILSLFTDSGPGAGRFRERQSSGECRFTLVGTNSVGTPKFAVLSNDSLVYRQFVSFSPMFIGRVGAFPAFNLATSKQRATGWYGYIWVETEGPDTGALFLRETSNNGQTWFSASRLSDSVPSTLSRSALAGSGTYDSATIHLLADLYDGSDVLHSQIWHYSKRSPAWRLVHDYSCPSGARLGDNALAADRPSIGVNRALGEQYAVWEQFDPDNIDPATGLCRADIWAARTAGAARNWSPAIRLTEPDSTSKRFPFLAEVVNDTLHIIYFADQVAGFWEQGQGPQTTNAVMYLRVPVNVLPAAVAEAPVAPVVPFQVAVTPNPFTSTTTIRLFTSSFILHPSSLAVRVHDAAGCLVHSSLGTGSSSFTLDLRSVPPGVYFLTARAGPNAACCRVVKTARAD